ncbi:hypothetical protein GE09DRAFT_1227188 [Coniochaeta sp. 2T2.1]|nr:hypothetical protein GE09DRAFT_1227188 [Coniochaeta sp. 2T2.1]
MSGEKYYPIYLQRSDGQGYLNDAENSDPVGQKDERLTRWRAVIGSHIKYQLGDDPTDKRLFILASLPDGYELREIKSGKTANVYLFGHPSNARYRTAGEFVPHVLWLISDSVDRNDCFCTPCMELVKRESRQVSASATPVQQHLAQPSIQPTAKPVSQGVKAGDAPAQQQVQQVQQPQQQPQQAQQQYQPAPATQHQAAAPSSTDMGITSPSNIFRLAELVWFKDRAWRLGIILSISPKSTNSSPQNPTFDDHTYIFTMAPLGHSIFRKPNQAKEASEMRPFLTFSVPDSPEYKTQPFSAVDWVAETEKRRQAATAAGANPQKNAQDMEYFCLEASKVAARTINNCFSLFNKQVDRVQGGSGFSMEFYSGVFLGAEMIVVGDPVRVMPPPKVDGDDKPTTVMRVDEIVLLVPHARNHAVNLQFRGTVFHLTRQPETQIDAASAGETHGGPFAEEVDYRNALLDQADRQARGKWTWQAAEKPALRNDDGIHGRFYVSHKLVQILHPDTWQATMREGGAPSMLNTRQHNGGGVPYAGRVADRRTGVGASITEGVLDLPGGIRE